MAIIDIEEIDRSTKAGAIDSTAPPPLTRQSVWSKSNGHDVHEFPITAFIKLVKAVKIFLILHPAGQANDILYSRKGCDDHMKVS